MHLLILLISLLLPNTHQVLAGGLSPPTLYTQVMVDTRLEDPPRYSGVGFAPRPTKGATLGFQIFLPQVAGNSAFSYLINFGPTEGFSKYFMIQDAKTWVRFTITSPDGQVNLAESQVDLKGSSASSARSIHFVAPPNVHGSGHIATLSLQAIEDVPPDLRLKLEVNVATYATTPPSRLLQMKAQATIHLQ